MEFNMSQKALEICYKISGAFAESSNLEEFINGAADVLQCGLSLRLESSKSEVSSRGYDGLPKSYKFRSFDILDRAVKTGVLTFRYSAQSALDDMGPVELIIALLKKYTSAEPLAYSERDACIAAMTEILDGTNKGTYELYLRIATTRFFTNDKDRRLRLICVASDGEKGNIGKGFEKLEKLFKDTLVFQYKGTVIVVLSGTHEVPIPDDTLANLEDILEKNSLCACIGDEFTNIFDMPLHYNRNCATAINAKSSACYKGSPLVYFDDYKFDDMFILARQASPDPSGTQFMASDVRKILESDRENGTDHLHTLYRFIENDCSYTATAKKLFIHKNTVVYRINKIKDTFKIDLSNSDTKFNIIASYRMLYLMDTL